MRTHNIPLSLEPGSNAKNNDMGKKDLGMMFRKRAPIDGNGIYRNIYNSMGISKTQLNLA